jgi:hypothetical protein
MNLSKIEHYLSDFLSFVETIENRGVESLEEISIYDDFFISTLDELKDNLEKYVINNFILVNNPLDTFDSFILDIIE